MDVALFCARVTTYCSLAYLDVFQPFFLLSYLSFRLSAYLFVFVFQPACPSSPRCAVVSMRSCPSGSSSGSRAPASPRSRARSCWSASAATSSRPACASPTWRSASMSWRASSPRPSSRSCSRTRRSEFRGHVILGSSIIQIILDEFNYVLV